MGDVYKISCDEEGTTDMEFLDSPENEGALRISLPDIGHYFVGQTYQDEPDYWFDLTPAEAEGLADYLNRWLHKNVYSGNEVSDE